MSEFGADPATPTLAQQNLRSRRGVAFWLRERLLTAGLVACAGFSVLVTLAIVVVLFGEAVRFFGMPEVSILEYLTGNEWNPLLGGEKSFGMWPLVTGTLMVTLISAIVSVPLGLVTAIYLSEYAPAKVRAFLKPVLEVLAGIPTVVYGFFALTIISPYFLIEPARLITKILEGEARDVFGFTNSTAAGIAVGIMCLPTVTSLSEDALRAVPRSLREGAYGLGATRFDVSVKVVTPAALSGVIAAFILAIARAVGETMIVALAAGGLAQMAFGPAPGQPSYAAQFSVNGHTAAVRLDPNDIAWLRPVLAPEDDAPSQQLDLTARVSIDESASLVTMTLTPEAVQTIMRSVGVERSIELLDALNPEAPPIDAASLPDLLTSPALGDALAGGITIERPVGAVIDPETGEPLGEARLSASVADAGVQPLTLVYDADDGLFDNLVFRPQSSSQTMTAYMVQIFLGDAEFASVEYHSSYAIGATLFLMTLVLTMLGNVVLRRYREAYQ